MRAERLSFVVEGHFGELLQGRLGPDGPLVLVTLPCACAQVKLVWHATSSFSQSGQLMLDEQALHGLWRGTLPLRGRWHWSSRFAPGLGAGVSTAARIAALGLQSRLARTPVTGMAKRLLASEGAVDPLMLAAPARHLWAPRQAESLECFDTAPRFDVLGAVMALPQRTDPSDLRFPDISDLVSAWRTADSPERAGLAAESAARTLRLRQGQEGAALAQTMAKLARDTSAMGWSIAHTGGLAALLFARGEEDLVQKAQAFRKIGARHVVWFGL